MALTEKWHNVIISSWKSNNLDGPDGRSRYCVDHDIGSKFLFGKTVIVLYNRQNEGIGLLGFWTMS